MATILERLHSDVEAEQQQHEANYIAIVRQIAGGEEPDGGQVRETLKALGRTVGDLQSAVSLFDDRKWWASQVAAVADADLAERNARDELKRLDDELTAAQQRHAREIVQHQLAIQDAAETRKRAAEARKSLQSRPLDPKDSERLKSLRSSIEGLSNSVNKLSVSCSTFDRETTLPAMSERLSALHREESDLLDKLLEP